MSLLEIKNLNVRFGDKNAVPVVDGLDLKVDKGEVLAIIEFQFPAFNPSTMAYQGPPWRITPICAGGAIWALA